MSALINKEALRRRYAQERDKRLRPDGIRQYRRLPDIADPHTPMVEREPKTDHVTFAFVGGGFAGLLTGAWLKEAGVDDVRVVEKGGDFGGTWYWNRYPGAQCDTASYVYLPLLEETGYMPTEKYVYGPEILEHSARIGRHYGLYDNALFHTRVTDLEWDPGSSRWIVRTNRGDEFTAQFVGMGTGVLHVAKLPGIPGIDTFRGHSFHTSRWDYQYTGGDAKGAPMDRLADKRVAVIGTGATAVQAVPLLSRACGELYVFQRTPSAVDVRDNRPTDPEWFAEIATPGWQQRWMDNFTANHMGGDLSAEDLVMDGWTDVARRVRTKVSALPLEGRTMEAVLAVMEDCDHEKMEELRARVDSIVEKPETAERLKAWYRKVCKRACFHDEYLQAYNQPNTHLVDTGGKGVERITETAVVVDGTAYEVDCIIYASGFEVGTEHTSRAGFDLTGRDGVTLSKYWAEGMRSLHGIHTHGFPNMFRVSPTQGANLLSNVPHNLTESGRTVAVVVKHMLENGYAEVDVNKAAEDAWTELMRTAVWRMGQLECTPGYYNNEGQEPPPWARLNVGYPHGPMKYFAYLDQWRRSGAFEGLTFH
jgi:cation diffusion facilitator CzcD-associated flavoprotein CzcO